MGVYVIAYGKCALIKNLDQPNLMYANLGINTQANSVGTQKFLASYISTTKGQSFINLHNYSTTGTVSIF